MTKATDDLDRLYIVVRSDLAPGPQLAQSVHAAFQFSVKYPEITRRWHLDSNFLVVLSVPDEPALIELCRQARTHGIGYERVSEPDYGNEFTAMALEPGDAARRLCARFPLALKEKVVL